MNSTQAKQLSLPDLMSRLGYVPEKVQKDGREVWYKSPFRAEKEASFVTSYLGGKWIWNDFGDTGGTIIDFVMRHENCNSVKDALTFLRHMFRSHLFEKSTAKRVGVIKELPGQASLFSFKQQSREAAPDAPQERELEFLTAHSISNPVIYQYLEEKRCIPQKIVDLYIQEIKYLNKNNNKEYFAFGMKNESDGYEIRAASDEYSFKSALKARDITRIRGSSPERKTVNIFEGMTDFLSLHVMLGVKQLAGDSIIMHSLSSFNRAKEVIESEAYIAINTFLDNNDAGAKGTARFQETFPGQTISHSDMFANYTDLNDALVANSSSV
jgi:hypothetical protein